MRLIGTVSAMLACVAMAAVGCSRSADNDGQINPERPGRTNMQPANTSRQGAPNAKVDGGAYGSSPQRTPATQSSADSLQSGEGKSSSGVPPSEYESPPGGIETKPDNSGSSSSSSAP